MTTTPQDRHSTLWNGWPLFGLISVFLLTMASTFLVARGFDTDSYRIIIRATARSSLALFLIAFLASSIAVFRPGERSQWLLRNRRAFGLGFAMSHLIHLAAIITLAQTDPATFWTLSNRTAITAGSIGYIIIALLAFTSFDTMVHWLGPRRWQRLHRFGLWFIWLFFVFTNAKRIPGSGWYLVPVALLLTALIVRLRARARVRGTMA